MSRFAWLLFPMVLLTACPFPASDSGDDGPTADVAVNRDDSARPDTAGVDAATGPCTTHRDCFTKPGDGFACDPATGGCVTPRLYFMPCDTDDDCKTYYNTSMKKCGPAKVCTFPCFNPGQAVGDTCPNQDRTCSFQSVCQCANDAACGEGKVCSTVVGLCMAKCLQDLDCVAMTGTTCDTATGQCVR